MGIEHPGAFGVLPDAVEAAVRIGDVDTAADLSALLERQARTTGPWATAASARARGWVSMGRGEPGEAVDAFTEAANEFDALGFRPDAARSLLGAGSALLRAGQPSAALDALTDARDRFAGFPAELWERRTVEQLERAAPGQSQGELTRTERRVAALVAQGMRNREIAASLFMSVPTVEAHLTRTYRKLGIRSRTELARLVTAGDVDVSLADAS
jgi:DNA-binding CsgD family transcriptional regulator